jgi:hypothetical protein
MIVGLSEFLRRTLEHADRAEVTLAEEVDYLQRYIDIQKLRERLQVSMDIPAEGVRCDTQRLIRQGIFLRACRLALLVNAGGHMTDIFAKSDPVVKQTYAAILNAVAKFGSIKADAKKTSIHLVAETGFAGVHPRRSAILLNIRSDAPIKSKRVRRVEKVSTNRYHNEMLLCSPSEVDAEVVTWLKAAHNLSVG